MVFTRGHSNFWCILWSNTISKVKKKIPANLLTEEELIASLDNKETKGEVLRYFNDVLPFLSHFNIHSGESLVSKKILYKLYSQWSKDPVTLTKFVNTTKDIVFDVQVNGQQYFKINESAIEISKKTFELVSSKTRDLDKSPVYRVHFENFINKYSLDKDETYIQGYVLWHLYGKWCYGINRKNKLGYRSFIMFCKLYLTSKRTGKLFYWFKVSKEIYNYVTKEEVEEIKKAYEEETIRKRSGKQKKLDEIPRTKSNSKSKK
jgi:hypothetical protein